MIQRRCLGFPVRPLDPFALFIFCASLSKFISQADASPIKNSCEFHGQQKLVYPIGAQWEVRVGSHKDFQCMNCTCLPETGVRCSPSITICPSLDDCMKVEDIPDSCCPRCTEVRNEPDKRSISAERQKSASECHHNGAVYADGDRWSPEANSTSIRPMENNQCVQCDCQNGKTICHLKGCTVPPCNGPTIITGDNCCPVCQEMSFPTGGEQFGDMYEMTSTGETDDDFDPSAENTDEDSVSECISGPEKYDDGAEWNPIIPPFGRMKCVVCRCESGKISCKRLECPVETLHCSHSQTVTKPGSCCPSCQENNEIVNVSATGPYLCLRRGDYLVYENLHGGTVEIALRLPEEEMISIHTWKISNANSEISSIELKMWEFRRDHPSPEGFRLLGIARSRRVTRFTRRILKIRDTCHQRCGKRIERLVEILRIRPAQSGKKEHCPDLRFRPVDTMLT